MMKIALVFVLKMVKFTFSVIFKFFKFIFFIAIYSDSQDHINTCNEIAEKDKRDYNNRVGKYSNDKRWYDE